MQVPPATRESPSPAPHSPSPLLLLLQEETEARIASCSFPSLLLWCLEHPLTSCPSPCPLPPRLLAQQLRLSPLQELRLLSYFCLHGQEQELRTEAQQVLQEKVLQVAGSLLSSERALLQSELEHSPLLLLPLLPLLPHLPAPLKERVTSYLRDLFPPTSCPLPLLPLLHLSQQTLQDTIPR